MATSYTWMVENFSKLTKNQIQTISPYFSPSWNDQIKFCLELYPNGTTDFWSNSHAMIFLWLENTNQDKATIFNRLWILDVKGEKQCLQGKFGIQTEYLKINLNISIFRRSRSFY